ncbi:MAG: outer membrane beta-barrel protein [Gemmatimonadetes bacterium]|nr:outer membrane beta-barrel protein [Gemmatimonadota bacterium]
MTLPRQPMVAALLCALAATAPHAAGAQTPRATMRPAPTASPIRIGVSGGLSIPAGDLGNATGAGAALALRGEGRLHNPRWALRADLAWDRFDGRGVVDAYSYASLAASLVHRESGGRVYEFGGMGVYNARTAFVNDVDRSATNLGMHAGAGVEFPTRAPHWFAEAGLTSAFTSGRSSIWLPVRVGFWF